MGSNEKTIAARARDMWSDLLDDFADRNAAGDYVERDKIRARLLDALAPSPSQADLAPEPNTQVSAGKLGPAPSPSGEGEGVASDMKYGAVRTERGTSEAGEPLFILRARDRAAVPTIASYLRHCEEHGADAAHLDGIRSVIERFAVWQGEHETMVPDSPAPAGDARERALREVRTRLVGMHGHILDVIRDATSQEWSPQWAERQVDGIIGLFERAMSPAPAAGEEPGDGCHSCGGSAPVSLLGDGRCAYLDCPYGGPDEGEEPEITAPAPVEQGGTDGAGAVVVEAMADDIENGLRSGRIPSPVGEWRWRSLGQAGRSPNYEVTLQAGVGAQVRVNGMTPQDIGRAIDRLAALPGEADLRRAVSEALSAIEDSRVDEALQILLNAERGAGEAEERGAVRVSIEDCWSLAGIGLAAGLGDGEPSGEQVISVIAGVDSWLAEHGMPTVPAPASPTGEAGGGDEEKWSVVRGDSGRYDVQTAEGRKLGVVLEHSQARQIADALNAEAREDVERLISWADAIRRYETAPEQLQGSYTAGRYSVADELINEQLMPRWHGVSAPPGEAEERPACRKCGGTGRYAGHSLGGPPYSYVQYECECAAASGVARAFEAGEWEAIVAFLAFYGIDYVEGAFCWREQDDCIGDGLLGEALDALQESFRAGEAREGERVLLWRYRSSIGPDAYAARRWAEVKPGALGLVDHIETRWATLDPAPVSSAAPECGSVSKAGLRCARPSGHGGSHNVENANGGLTWWIDDPAPAPSEED